MSRPDKSKTAPMTETTKVKDDDDESTNNPKGTKLLPPPKWRFAQFLDVDGPWVLVPNGSYRGYFDNVPESFRVGPWNIACCMYLFAVCYWILWECVQCYNQPPNVSPSDYQYFNTHTWQWYYNAAGFAWALFICHKVAHSQMGLWAWMSYTLQSWTLITLRHGLSTLVPLFPAVAQYNEFLRFPMLLQTTIVFVLWNFALLPAILLTMKDRTTRLGFVRFCFGFDLVNLHILNLPLAVMNGVLASPVRELNRIDFCVALVLSLQYILFYLFVLDRLGLHFYFIFSPRTPLALVSWSALLGCIYAGFAMWKSGIVQYGIPLSS